MKNKKRYDKGWDQDDKEGMEEDGISEAVTT